MTDETRAAVDKACAAAEASIEMLRDEVKRLREKVLDAVNAFDCRTSLNCWQEDDIGEYVVTAKSVHDFVAETRKLLAAPESRPAAPPGCEDCGARPGTPCSLCGKSVCDGCAEDEDASCCGAPATPRGEPDAP